MSHERELMPRPARIRPIQFHWALAPVHDVSMTQSLISWNTVAERLAAERNIWLSTVSLNGAPHVAPVWGAIVDEAWHFYSERGTVKSRNLAMNSRIALHLGDGDDVLIVHGAVEDLGHPSTRADVVASFAAKYTLPGDLPYLPLADPAFDVLYLLRPSRALLWNLADYDGSQRRWHSNNSYVSVGSSPVFAVLRPHLPDGCEAPVTECSHS